MSAYSWHQERRKIIVRIDELLSIESEKTDISELASLQQKVLDVVNLAGLGSNPIYGQIERLCVQPRGYSASNWAKIQQQHSRQYLEDLRERLEFVPRLARASRRKVRRKVLRRFPRAGADSRGRARSVAMLYEELRIISPRLSTAGEELEELRKHYPSFQVFQIVEARPKLRTELVGASSSKRILLRLAQKLASHYHEKEVSTIETDWKDHKPKMYKRRRR